MKKLCLWICTLLILIVPVTEVKAAEVDLRSQNVIVVSLEDQEILYEDKSNEKIYPASLTKIMTALVAIENTKDLDAYHTMNSNDLAGLVEANASVAGFRASQKVTYRDLLYGIMLPSGADATQAVANDLFGSEEGFVQKMNEKADELQLNNTHFVNTSGLHDEDHYSTVADLAKLLEYALQNETFKEIFCTDSYTISDSSMVLHSTKTKYLANYSMDDSFILGTKTGYTGEAGLCLATYGEFHEIPYVMVSAQTNSNNKYPYHFEDAGKMNTYLTERFQEVTVFEENETLPVEVNVKYGDSDTLKLTAPEDITYLQDTEMKNDLDYEFKLDKRYDEDAISAPLEKDTLLGRLVIKDGEKEIYSGELYLQEKLESNKIKYYMRHPEFLVKYIVGIVIVILLAVLLVICIKVSSRKRKNRRNRRRRRKNRRNAKRR